jgi:predicted kinase
VVTLSRPFPCPPPAQAIDWSGFDPPWAEPMVECLQDPEYHGEGDVWTHTRMVCEELVRLPGWQALDREAREVLFAAALLHDVATPACRREEEGHIRHPNHSLKGAVMARRILWELGAPLAFREQVAGLIRYHQTPFFLITEKDPLRKAVLVSQSTRCDHLALLAQADGLGRVCADRERIAENVGLFEEFCREEGCLDRPWPFPSDHSRFLYFRTPGRDPRYHAYDDTCCEVTLLSGLPGAGKSHWLREHPSLPVVSLDDLRAELRLRPTDDQGPVLERARERVREHLRRGESFALNGTNLSRDTRRKWIDLFALYNPRVRIVYVDASRERLFRQNRSREEAVPEAVIERMLRLWDVPDRTEAHQVEWVVRE